jgi:prepilin signal peptidase PulO-like enzyme (type II secretory pathway)
MMVLIFATAGIFVGWLLHNLANVLPRFSASQPPVTTTAALHPSALRRLGRQPEPAHLLAEILSAVFFGYAGARWGFNAEGLLAVVYFSFFVLVALIDWKYQLVLNVMTYPAILTVLLLHLLQPGTDLRSILLGGAFAFAIFFLTAWLRPGDLGGGDIKLAALIGLVFGFPGVLGALLVGALAGGAATVTLLLRGSGLKARMPYAPFLCLGAIALLVYQLPF